MADNYWMQVTFLNFNVTSINQSTNKIPEKDTEQSRTVFTHCLHQHINT